MNSYLFQELNKYTGKHLESVNESFFILLLNLSIYADGICIVKRPLWRSEMTMLK